MPTLAELKAKAAAAGNGAAAPSVKSVNLPLPEVIDAQRRMREQLQAATKEGAVYFHCSHPTMGFVVGNRKMRFINHFLITTDPEVQDFVRKQLLDRKTGSVKFMEVSVHAYQASTMIQPQIEPIPDQDAETADQQELKSSIVQQQNQTGV